MLERVNKLDFLTVYLPICIYILLIILLIVGIILFVRLISTVDKINSILEDVEGKVSSLNGLFNIIDYTTDRIANLSDSLMGVTSKLFAKFTNRKKKKYYDDEIVEEREEEDIYE